MSAGAVGLDSDRVTSPVLAGFVHRLASRGDDGSGRAFVDYGAGSAFVI